MPFDISPPLAAAFTFMAVLHGLASNPNSGYRLVALVVLGLFAYHVYFIHPPTYTENRVSEALIAFFVWIQCFKALDDLIITPAAYYDPNIPLPPRKSDSTQRNFTPANKTNKYARYRWAFSFMWNMRGIGSPSEIDLREDGTYWEYMQYYTLVIASCYAALDPAIHSIQVNQDLLNKGSYFPGFSLREFFLCANLWKNFYCLIRLVYAALQFIHVGLGIHKPSQWPHLFGGLDDFNSVGSFWRNFWHQIQRRPIAAFYNRCHPPTESGGESLASGMEYTRILLFFSVSGFTFLCTVLAVGAPRNESYAILPFFIVHTVIVILEDAMYDTAKLNTTPEEFASACAGWRNFVGLPWTIFILYMTTPLLLYPIARQLDPVRDNFVPYSFYNNHVAAWWNSMREGV